MSGTRKLIKTESLPLLLPVGFSGQQIFFDDDQYIRNKKLMSLTVTPGTFGQKYVDNKPIVQYDVIPFAFLTLESYSGTQFVRRKPLLELVNMASAANAKQDFYYEFIGQRVNWPKSYVEFSPPGGGIVYPADAYILFDVQFTELTQEKLKRELGTGFNNKR